MSTDLREVYPNPKGGWFFFTPTKIIPTCKIVTVQRLAAPDKCPVYRVEVRGTQEQATLLLSIAAQGIQKIIPIMYQYKFERPALIQLSQWASQSDVLGDVDGLARIVLEQHNAAAADGKWFRPTTKLTYWQQVFAHALPTRETFKLPVSLAVEAV